MITKEERDRISQIVGEYFLRVVKNNNYYLIFKKSFLKAENMHDRLVNVSKEKTYAKAIDRFAEYAMKEYEAHRREDSTYEYITVLINTIMRQYLENGGVNPRYLGMIGQELFDLSCYGIYGEQYLIDMDEMNKANGGMRAPRNDKEAWLMAEYESRIRNGEKLNFEDFMRERIEGVSDEEFWEHSRDEHGFYGEQAEDNEFDLDEFLEEGGDNPWND